MRVADALAPAAQLALVGLAKNTGKTVALGTIVRELHARGDVLGVTSIGEDGEPYDALDRTVAKPPIELPAGAWVATTDALMGCGSARVEVVEPTPHRTPLGRVAIGRVARRGTVRVAGPVALGDVAAVGRRMRELGAARVLIDGAIDRRAGASPKISDGVVLSTGAVLDADMERVGRRTKAAVELLRLPTVSDPVVREIAATRATSALVTHDHAVVPLPPRIALDGRADVADLLARTPGARHIVVKGALSEAFLARVAAVPGRPALTVVVDDATKAFLAERPCAWYRRQGVALEALAAIALWALTVNPVAPRRHRFDSRALRARIAAAVPDVPVFDVLDPIYPEAA